MVDAAVLLLCGIFLLSLTVSIVVFTLAGLWVERAYESKRARVEVKKVWASRTRYRG